LFCLTFLYYGCCCRLMNNPLGPSVLFLFIPLQHHQLTGKKNEK
jgi:hypothetical protein